MKKLFVIPVLLLLAVLLTPGLVPVLAPAQSITGNMTFPPSSTRWVNAADGTQAGTSLGAANATRLFGFTLDVPIIFSNIVFNVSTADTTAGTLCGAFADCYSVGIYSASAVFAPVTGNIVPAGTLVANCNAMALKTIGVVDCATAQGSRTLMPGVYYFAFTGTATTAAITYGAGGISFASNALPSAGGTTTNGALNSEITPPADSWIVSSARQLVFALHN